MFEREMVCCYNTCEMSDDFNKISGKIGSQLETDCCTFWTKGLVCGMCYADIVNKLHMEVALRYKLPQDPAGCSIFACLLPMCCSEPDMEIKRLLKEVEARQKKEAPPKPQLMKGN